MSTSQGPSWPNSGSVPASSVAYWLKSLCGPKGRPYRCRKECRVGMNPHTDTPSLLKQADTMGSLLQQAVYQQQVSTCWLLALRYHTRYHACLPSGFDTRGHPYD